MDQTPQQRTYGFQPGVSGNPAGRLTNKARAERIAALARELAVEHGGWESLSACDRVLLTQAATLLLRRRRNGDDTLRTVNAIARLLAQVREHRPGPRGPVNAVPDLHEYLASKATAP